MERKGSRDGDETNVASQYVHLHTVSPLLVLCAGVNYLSLVFTGIHNFKFLIIDEAALYKGGMERDSSKYFF